MLATLLPGLRDVRVPLASGLVWLAVLAVSVSWALPSIKPTLLVTQFVTAGGFLGGATLLTVIAFVGYLIGLVLSEITSFDRFPSSGPGVSSTSLRGVEQRVAREIRGARLRRVPFDRLLTEVSAILEGADGERATSSLAPDEEALMRSTSEAERWRWLERGGAIDRLTSVVFSDLGLAELSLQVDSRDVYDKYDRMRAEAEFRRAIAPPVAALSIAVAARCVVEFGSFWPLFALIGLVPAWALWASGGQRLLESRDLMIQAILGGQAVSPTLKLISDLEPSV